MDDHPENFIKVGNTYLYHNKSNITKFHDLHDKSTNPRSSVNFQEFHAFLLFQAYFPLLLGIIVIPMVSHMILALISSHIQETLETRKKSWNHMYFHEILINSIISGANTLKSTTFGALGAFPPPPPQTIVIPYVLMGFGGSLFAQNAKGIYFFVFFSLFLLFSWKRGKEEKVGK